MAEVNSFQAAEIAAGRKVVAATQNNVRALYIRTPTNHAFQNGDTMGSGLVLPPGTRALIPTVSCGAGTASSTISVGLRNPKTKAAIAAGALVTGQSITSAVVAQPVTGSYFAAGADSVLTEEAEVYVTFGGADPTANQQVAVYLPYIAP